MRRKKIVSMVAVGASLLMAGYIVTSTLDSDNKNVNNIEKETTSSNLGEEKVSQYASLEKRDSVMVALAMPGEKVKSALVEGETETSTEVTTEGMTEVPAEVQTEAPAEPETKSEFADIAIAQVNDYVNIRSAATTESEVVGKLYNNSAATILGEENGWYQISSGSVASGYVKSEYVVVGDENLAKSVATRYAKVNTETLFVRSEPTTESSIIYMLPMDEDLVAIDESTPGWIKVSTEAGDGFISADYVIMSTDFVQAESKEEEEARLKKEEEERKAAEAAAKAAIAAANAKKETATKATEAATKASASSDSSSAPLSTSSNNVSAPTSVSGQAVVDYACQFVGNPYVYGGTSLTNGADCSGFVMSVYAAFGISLPHSSASLRNSGYEVSLSEIQPGDIVCYSGHVAIYVGNDTIVHASTPATGIKYTSPVSYKSVITVRRIF